MKTYKNFTYTVLALSVMIFLSAGQVSALMEPGDLSGFDRSYASDFNKSYASDPKVNSPFDFNKGRNAGIEAGKENVNSCSIGSYDTNIEANEARTAYLDKHMDQEKSGDFIAGFNSGYNDSARLYNYSYCGK